MVEVDASEVGVGAVLSQRSSSDDRCTLARFFSHRLSSADVTTTLVTESLLAVNLALEECVIGWRVGGTLYCLD